MARSIAGLLFCGFLSFSLGQAGVWGCRSSTSGAGGGGEEAGDTTGSTGTVSDLSTLPNLDLSAADTSSASFSALPGLKESHVAVGGSSDFGCMSINFMKPTSLASLKEAEAMKCYMRTTQDSTAADTDASNDFSVATDSYTYVHVGFAAQAQGPKHVRARIGNFGDTFRMDVCSSGDGSSYTQNASMDFTASDTTWSGGLVSHFSSPDGSFNDFVGIAFDIAMASAEAIQQEFSLANVSTVDTTLHVCQDPTTSDVQSDTSCPQIFRLGFGYDGSTVRNSVTGSFSDTENSISGILHSEFDSDEGVGKGEATMGGQTQTDTEAFNPATLLVVANSAVSFYSEVADATLGAAVTQAEALAAVTFGRSWDCTAESGSSFVEVDGSAIDYTPCDALMNVEHEGFDCFGLEGGEGGGDLPTPFTLSNTGYTSTCPVIANSTESGSAPVTVSSQTSSSFVATDISTDPDTVFAGTKSGNRFTAVNTGDPIDTGGCVYRPVTTILGQISPFSCTSGQVVLQKVSGNCSAVIGAGDSCTLTYTGIVCSQ